MPKFNQPPVKPIDLSTKPRQRYRKRLEEVRDLVQAERSDSMTLGGLRLGRAIEVLASICNELAEEVDLARKEGAK